MSKTVTFVVKQTQAHKLQVADGTTVRKLRELVASMGYDVIGNDTRIRIVRDGVAIIGHTKDYPLRRNDIVVFESDAIRLQVSPEVAASYKKPAATVANPCNPSCCNDRAEELKARIADALLQLAQKITTF